MKFNATSLMVICWMSLGYYNLIAQHAESYVNNNLARIAEIATPEGVLPNYHTLIGMDSTGLIKQSNLLGTYKIFGYSPNLSHLNLSEGNNGFNNNDKFGIYSGSDCYEIRYGEDSSQYWIGTKLAKNKVPFSVYNVGIRSASNPTVSGGTKLIISVVDQDNDSLYTSGERIYVFGDYALPLDSTYNELGNNPSRPFNTSTCLLTNFRTGKNTVSYANTSFNVTTDGILPPQGTVIRFISKQADTTLPYIYPPKLVYGFGSGRVSYSLNRISLLPYQYSLINAPAGMSISNDTLYWDVNESHFGNEYIVTIRISNSLGSTANSFHAVALQSYPVHHTNNLARIVEVATPSGVLTQYHNLIGLDSTGTRKQSSADHSYAVFADAPVTSNLNPMDGSNGFNVNNKFGINSGNDSYEIRYGDDSSNYWIGNSLAKNKLPFSVYNVGMRSALNSSVSGGIKMLITVTDENNDSLYSPGEKVHVFGDYLVPLDSTYEELGNNSIRPFSTAMCLISNFRTGKDTLSYKNTAFNVLTDGVLPPAGTVLRLVNKQADTTLPYLFFPDSVFATGTRQFNYPIDHYSLLPHTFSLINAPEGMSLSDNSIIWVVEELHIGHEYEVVLLITNDLGTTQKTFIAKAFIPESIIPFACGSVMNDSIRKNMIFLVDSLKRNSFNPDRRIAAEWIQHKFFEYGYDHVELDSFTVPEFPTMDWQYNVVATLHGTHNPDSVFILGAHYDASALGNPINFSPGADDNASGTSAVLEIARVVKLFQYNPKNTIKFITFAAEEQGLYGSADYATKAKNQNLRIQCMVNHDVIGYCPDSLTMWKNRFVYNQGPIPGQLITAIQALEQHTTLNYILDSSGYSSDEYSFTVKGFKVLRYKESVNSPYWHTINDIMSNCNLSYIAEITKASMAFLLTRDQESVVEIKEQDVKNLKSFIVFQNYPNPFNPSTTIRYQLALNAKVTVKIYNTLGQEVATLVKKRESAGTHAVQWNGKDRHGKFVASGVYMYRIEAVSEKGKFAETRKMVFMK